jgi:hypothetical protein
MINIICAICRPLPIRSTSQRTQRSLDPMLRWITGITPFHFQFKIQIITHSRVKLSCSGFSYGPNTHNAVGRVSRSRATFDVATTAAFNWILTTTAFSRLSRSEFQHSSPTFLLGILATVLLWAPPAGGQAPPWGMTTPTP